MKTRNTKDIVKFMRELPGGNVTQYAKLLNTTPQRITSILIENKDGRALARGGLVRAAERGMMPSWAGPRTVRGSLRATDVDRMRRENTLPEFIRNLLSSVHPRFQDDALNFFREALEQTANQVTFEAQIKLYMDQDRHRTDEIVTYEERTARLESEIDRYDRLLEKASKVSHLLESRVDAESASVNASTDQQEAVA